MNKKVLTTTVGFLIAVPMISQEIWSLEKCIDYAIGHNLTVKQQEAARDKNAIDLNTARWSRLPDLNGNASHSFNFGRSLQANNTYQSINTQSTGFSVSTSIPLFTGSSTQPGRCAVFSDTVQVDNAVSMITKKALNDFEATTVEGLTSQRSSTWLLPFLVLWYDSVQVSGNAIR